VWLCEELQIPYQLKRYERDATSQLAPAAYKALHPFGTAPVVTDGPLVLAESGAIIQYLIATYGNNRLTVSAGEPNFTDYLFWFHFANGSLMPALLIDIIVARLGDRVDPRLVTDMRARAERAFSMIERRLGETKHFAGDGFTAADIMMLFPLTTMRHFAQRDLTSFANIRAYLARIGARPAFQRAMQKADPNFTPLLS
jgi:glutathione S-transferase